MFSALLVLNFIDFSSSNLILPSQSDFTLLRNFACAVAKGVLKKNPEMQGIALIELENNFSRNFGTQILKCLPGEVFKVTMQPHESSSNAFHPIRMAKSSLIIYIADKVENVNIYDLDKI